MKLSTIFNFLICTVLFLFIFINAESKGLMNSDNNDKFPKMQNIQYNYSYYLTFHPCFMNVSDTNNSVSIFVVSTEQGNVKLNIPGLNIERTQNFLPFTVVEFKLTPFEALPYLRSPSDTVPSEQVFQGKAIKISSDVQISCYGIVKFKGRTECYNALPVNSLGNNYQITSSFSDEEPTYTSIVGCYDNSNVTFKLGGSEGEHIIKQDGDTLFSNTVIRRNLNEGDVWLIPGSIHSADLSGSIITSTKPLAVTSGSYSKTPTQNSPNSNYLIEQELPINEWGTKYYISPVYSCKNYPTIKIFSKLSDTKIFLDATPIWNIQTPGKSIGTGYFEVRSGIGSPAAPAVISSDSGFPINVVQYNPDDSDFNLFNIPFKMQVLPIEQFYKSAILFIPNKKGDIEFDSNYVNIVYKSYLPDIIPDDMLLGRYIDGKINWIRLNKYTQNVGSRFVFDSGDKYGRSYYNLTLKLPADSVYILKTNLPFAANIYGKGKNGSYGYSIMGNMLDLTTPDTIAPSIKINQCCCSKFIEGVVTDEPVNDPDNRSNLALIKIDPINSYNFTLNYDSFVVGLKSTIKWQLNVDDESKNASAHLIFQDRAGNQFDTVINYISYSLKIFESKVDFGEFKSINPPKIINKVFTLKNLSGHSLDADRFAIYLVLDSKIQDNKANDINTFQNFTLEQVEDLNLCTIDEDAEIKFNVSFSCDSYGSFRDSIGIVVIDLLGSIDTCSVKYFAEISASVNQTYIIADDYNFNKQYINKKSDTIVVKIANPKTAEFNSASDFKITSFDVTGDNAGLPGTGAIFEIDGLQNVSESNPVIIEPGNEHQLKVSFKPDSAKVYESRITFHAIIKDANDIINLPDNVTILKGVGEKPVSVNNTDINYKFIFEDIYPNPIIDNYFSINFTLGENVNYTIIKLYDYSGKFMMELFSGNLEYGKHNILKTTEGLSQGLYFIEIKSGTFIKTKKLMIVK